jgi:hypothetical protein
LRVEDVKRRFDPFTSISMVSPAFDAASGLKRINDLEKGKTVEIRIVGVDPPDPMLAHEDGSVCVMD